MIRINIHEAKTQLSRYLRRLEKGETIILCRRNVPIAELRPLPPVQRRKRAIGLAQGELVVGPAFFEPLPAELIDAFEGRS